MRRTIQQVKEHGKNPPNQTKEEEIRSIPGKEFRIMIVKMIQSLEKEKKKKVTDKQTRDKD